MADNERSKSIAEKLHGEGLTGEKNPRRKVDLWVGFALGLAVAFVLLIMSNNSELPRGPNHGPFSWGRDQCYAGLVYLVIQL